MQGIFYDQDVEPLDKLLQLYKTYYIGNAKIKEITSNAPIFASTKYQMLPNRSTYISLVSEEEQLPINHVYQLTSFAQCPAFADVATKQINLLCSVVHVFPPRFVEKTKRNLQEFVIVNEERKPLLLTLWEEFLQTEAPFLTHNVHTFPVILGMRLSVNTFYGLSIGTEPNSTILFDPPIQQSDLLKRWLRFQAQLFDGTGNLTAFIEKKEAIMLLCASGEDMIEAEENHKPFTPEIFNEKSRELQFLFQLRTLWSKTRGKTFVRNTVIACLPVAESSSTSHSYEHKSSAAKVLRLTQHDVCAAESQERSSAMQEEQCETDLRAQPYKLLGKRKLEPEEVLHESTKHMKQD